MRRPSVERPFIFFRNADLRMLEINSVKINFWFPALSPFISAVVAFATAALIMRRSRTNFPNRAGASIWDVC